MKLSHVGYVAIVSLLASSPCFADPALQKVGVVGPRREPDHGALARRWARERSVGAAAALGHAELRLGMAVEAAEHLTFALSRVEDTDSTWVDIVYDLAAARRMIVTLHVRAPEPGSAVFVDDRHVGDGPFERDVFVDEGRHEVRATLAGFDAEPVSVHGAMGARIDVDLRMTPTPAPEVAPPVPARALRTETGRLPGKSVWIFGGGALLALGALGAGTGFAVAAINGRGDQESMNRYAGMSLTAGGVLLGATLTYALWPAPTSRQQEPPLLVVGIAPERGGSGLRLAGTLGP